MTTFGERLRELRKERQMTQKELGDLIGLSDRAIGYYESGERFADENVLNRLRDIFQVSMSYLLGESDDRVIYPTTPDREIAPGLVAHEMPLPPGLTADSPQEDWAAVLADAIARAGIGLTETARRQIAEAAAAVVSTLARQKSAEAAEKQIRRHGQENGSAPEK